MHPRCLTATPGQFGKDLHDALNPGGVGVVQDHVADPTGPRSSHSAR